MGLLSTVLALVFVTGLACMAWATWNAVGLAADGLRDLLTRRLRPPAERAA